MDLSTLFPEYGLQQQQVQRKQQLAQLLAQQAITPDKNEVVDGMVVRQSPLQGLTKLAQALISKNQTDDADKQGADNAKALQAALFGKGFSLDGSKQESPTDFQNNAGPGGYINPPNQQQGGPTAPITPVQTDPLSGPNAPLGIRNNNPGNIRPNGDQWQGMTGIDNGYVKFDSPENGIRALAKNLMSYDKKGINTINDIVDKWSPSSDGNNTAAYKADLANQLGQDPSKPIDLKDPQNALKLARAITQHENGQVPYSDAQFQTGVSSAFQAPMTNAAPQQMAQSAPPQGMPAPQPSAGMPPQPGAMPPQPGQQQSPQDNGLLGNMFARNHIDPREGAIRLALGDQSVLKDPTQISPNDRYKVVSGQLVDLGAKGGPQVIQNVGGSAGGNVNPLIGSDVHGEEFLNTLNPVDRAAVKLVASGDEKSSGILSRMKGDEKKLFLAQVEQYNPDYNARQFGNVTQFETGKLGSQVRSLNVAGSHLQTLDGLADALNNGNTQLFNSIANNFSKQTGSPAVTNFEAAKEIVGDEVAKAVVGATGALGDREAIKENIKNASSPAQLKGVISTYKTLIDGQKSGLQQQYEQSTGRKDFSKFLEGPTSNQQSDASAKKVIKWDDLK